MCIQTILIPKVRATDELNSVNLSVVTLYATLGPTAIAHGLNETQVTHIITSKDLLQGRLKVPTLLASSVSNMSALRYISLNFNYLFLSHFPPLLLCITTFQTILCDVPRLQYIIVVDSKRSSWTDIPRDITIYNMDAVMEMGSKPENSECRLIKKGFNLALEMEVR